MNLLAFLKEHVPCYIYNGEQIAGQCQKLKTELSDFEFLYSIKTNPFSHIIQNISKEGFGADAASAGEVFLSLDNGIAPENIFYSAPGKTEKDIEMCYGKCTIIADSISEIKHINVIAARHKEIVKIGIRVNPNFSMQNECGTSSKFGIDIEQLLEGEDILAEYSNIKVAGFHIHIQSQILDFQILGRYYKNCFELAKKIHSIKNVNIEFINFGSGIGALYRETQDTPVDLEKLNNMISEIAEENRAVLNARLLIETGRFITCNAGRYYTHIIDIKESLGQKYLIVENAMNGFMRPSIANLIYKTAGEILTGYEPLYTCQDEFAVQVLNESTEKERVNIVGNLCTALDVIRENAEVNHTQIGDIIEITNAGSYAYSLSPLLFSSHRIPKQYYLYKDKISGDEIL
ncbi:pyridoxal-dependent decarboxylase [Fusobacterium sp.]|uniref:diaminopimelate decarboxylase family protein n=1 Tax=Fusobacterium sp. TaxID=68766 RepID=UPI0028FF78E8|nr:pyridoxal-dependent decarboxylase [Fusobacterium sp.]MDU1912176.1 pyridoxal-dependent decarboxylase [Fusobacterium sp.]